MNARRFFFCAISATLVLAGCSNSTHATPPTAGIVLDTPKSVSPGKIAAAPMARTTILSPRVMAVKPHFAAAGQNWTQIPGSASFAAGTPDGSLWVLSDQPAGADKYIWHYKDGSWTNIPGLANHLAVAPNGTLYAINAGGGTYSYSNGVWSALGGGASGIAAAADGSIYVLSNGGAGPDRALWHNTAGTWTQVPGSGVSIAGSFDPATYGVAGGTISPNGFYILNAQGAIYYENSNGTFAQLPGNASAIAPAMGGVYALGYPANAGGNSLYYNPLSNAGWTAETGNALSISSGAGNLYAIGASGAIFSIAATSPVSLHIVNNNPNIPSSSINIYVFGQIPGSTGPTWEYVTASGTTVPMSANGASIPPIPFGPGPTSNPIYLPPLTSARIYIVGGTFNFNIPVGAAIGNGPNSPAPWTADSSTSLYFDNVEYTWNNPGAINVDTSQVDSFNLSMSVTVNGAGGSGTFGFLSGAVTQLHNAMTTAGGQWATLNNQWPYRVMNPGHGDRSGFFSQTNFLDVDLQNAWEYYKPSTGRWMALDLTAAGFSTYYGQLDSNDNFNFYTTPSTSGTQVAQILSPFSSASTAAYGHATMQTLANNGVFANPTGSNLTLALAIGNRVVGALNRGTIETLAQPACSVPQYPSTAAYKNVYAQQLHAIANNSTYGFGGAYAFAYDDSCATSTDTSVASPTSMTITINPS